MSRRDAPGDHPSGSEGATTAGDGTAVAVDVSADPRARSTLALFVAGPMIWTAHFLLIYLIVEAGCTGDGPGLRLFDPPVPTVVTLATTAVAAVACLASAAWGYRRWRADQHQRADEPGGLEPAEGGGSLALAGSLLSLLGFVTVLFVGLPALVLPAC
ncbi:MAG: hypothetical protein M3O70_19800 [Actinomycetota bacterium]|nr:hypothetical protein [Actinomycetota bacterium]